MHMSASHLGNEHHRPCKIAESLSLRFPPLALLYADEAPADASDLKPLCSMLLVAQAAKGKTIAITQGTCGCPGAAEGWGLAPPCPDHFPGGRDCYLRFLSTGNEDSEEGRAIIQSLIKGGAPKIMVTEFSEGEGFFKSPKLVAQWLEELPVLPPAAPFVVMKPLALVSDEEKPTAVTFLVDPDQLSALVVLANFARPGTDNVRIPFGAGCASLALYPFHEARQASPRAVIGLTDISARYYLRKPLGKDILSFTAPWSLFEEMEESVSESFLTRFAWKSMMAQDAD
jgi:hypothetical protein